MFDFFYSIDLSVFYFINHSLANPIFDKFFVFITDVKNWYLTFIFLWFICFFKGGKIGKIAAIIALLLVTVSDQLSSFVIKNFVSRIRPCNALHDVRILVGCTNSFSFPSSHAVNNFAAAVFFYKLFPKLKWILFTIASLIAISRVYVGKHYPSDVAGGAIIGAVIGYFFAIIALQIDQYFKNKNNEILDGRQK